MADAIITGNVVTVEEAGQTTPAVTVVSTVELGPTIQGRIVTGGVGPVGPGVDAGGTTGQYLKKSSGTDYDTEWSNFDAQVQTSRLDQMAEPQNNISMNDLRIISLLDPTDDQDAATKAYVDSHAGGGGGGTGEGVAFAVAQTAHGLVVGDVVRNTGVANTYTKAQADSAANAEVVGIVTTVTNVNNFTLTTDGLVTEGVPVAPAGTVMFLSPSVPGALTSTEPTDVDDISKPLVIVLESNEKMVFVNYRGDIVTDEGSGSGSPLTVQDIDGTPAVSNVTTMKFTNGTVTDNGSGVVTVTTGGGGGGVGDVVGPGSSTDNAITRFDSTTGKLLQNSVVTVGDTGNIAGVGTLSSGEITSTGATSLGSLALTTDLPITEGGTGSSTAATARAALGTQAASYYTVGTAHADYIIDGSADNVEIQSAINAAYTAGGGTVLVKDNCSTSAAIRMRDNVTLQLEPDVVITLANTTNTNIIEAYDPTLGHDFITVRGGTLNGNKSNQSSSVHGISINNSRNTRIEGVTIHDCKRHGVVFDGSLTAFVTVRGCVSYSNGDTGSGGEGIGVLDNVTKILIDGNRCYSNGGANIAIHGYGSYVTISNNFVQNSGNADNITGYNNLNSHVTVVNNQCLDGNNHGIHFAGANLIVCNNQVEDCTFDGIRIESSGGGAAEVTNSIVSNNTVKSARNGIYFINVTAATIHGNIVTAPTGTGTGILLDSVDQASVKSNQIVGSGVNFDGIRLHKSARNIVVGNLVKNNGRNGIYLSDDNVTPSNYNLVTNNHCYDTQTPKTQTNGILSQNSADYNFIIGNYSQTADNLTSGITLGNTNNIQKFNAGYYELGLDFDGSNTRTILQDRHASAAGQRLMIQAGGAVLGGTNIAGGELRLSSGISTGSAASIMSFYTAADSTAGTTDRTPGEKMRLSGSTNGRLLIGGTTFESGADGLSLGGTVPRVVKVNRHTTAGSAGNTLTVTSGGANSTSPGTDKAAGALVLSTGISTGAGTSQILLKTADVGSTGTTDNALTTRVTVDNSGVAIAGALTITTPLAVAQGGSGAATLTGVLKGNGTSAVTGSATLTDVGAPTADFSMNTHKLTSVTDPTGNQDAATKAYVDSVAQGLNAKNSCVVATTANISLTGEQTIDGVLTSTSRILVKNQSTAADNGIYVTAAGAWTRATDADISAEVTTGLFTFITGGTAQANTGWVLTTPATITLGVTSLTFSQFSAVTTIVGGAGLTLTGSTLDVVGTSNRISVAADSIDISSSYVGQATITTLGTITTGVWTGTDVAIADGGTGSSTASGARTNLGLGSIATQAASAVSITGGDITGITDLALADGGTGASDPSTARTNLGLGSIATQSSGSVTITGGSVTGITDIAVADGGTGSSTAGGARTNLGLGTISTQDSSAVTITGGSVTGITDVAIADGGTGQSTATLGFNALSPLTTQGDLIYHNGTNNVRLAKGTASQHLRMNSGATAPEWATVANRNLVELSSDQTNATTTFANLGNLSFAVTSGVNYRFYAIIAYSPNAITTGIRVSVTAPATTYLIYKTSTPLSSTGSASNDWVNGQATTDAGTVSTSSPSATASIIVIEGFIRPSASGTLQLRYAAETGGTVVCRTGSSLEVW